MTDEDRKSDSYKAMIFGFCFMLLTLGHGFYLYYLEHAYLRTDAVILEKYKKRCGGSKTSYRCDEYLVSFTDSNNARYQKRIEGKMGDFEIGQTHPLIYSPDDPNGTARSPRMMNRIFIIYGFVFLLGACLSGWGISEYKKSTAPAPDIV